MKYISLSFFLFLYILKIKKKTLYGLFSHKINNKLYSKSTNNLDH